MEKRITIPEIIGKKQKGERITVLTAYDYPTAAILSEAGIDILLVGDSLAMVVQGRDSTIPVTVDEIIYHSKWVVKANKHAVVVVDMPFLSYEISTEEAIKNAGRILKESGADAVKLEGGEEITPTIKALLKAGIPVMGHIGLLPQSVGLIGGYKVQGRDVESAKRLIKDAKALEEAGVFAIVLESIPLEVAKHVTESIRIPTIGIGAGPFCDGQVLVTHDMLGIYKGFRPKFVKLYADLHAEMLKAVKKYISEVKEGTYPSREYSYSLSHEVLKELQEELS